MNENFRDAIIVVAIVVVILFGLYIGQKNEESKRQYNIELQKIKQENYKLGLEK